MYLATSRTLYAVYCIPCTYCVLHAAKGALYNVYGVLCAARCILHTVRCLPYIVCCILFIARCSLYIAYYMLYIVVNRIVLYSLCNLYYYKLYMFVMLTIAIVR